MGDPGFREVTLLRNTHRHSIIPRTFSGLSVESERRETSNRVVLTYSSISRTPISIFRGSTTVDSEDAFRSPPVVDHESSQSRQQYPGGSVLLQSPHHHHEAEFVSIPSTSLSPITCRMIHRNSTNDSSEWYGGRVTLDLFVSVSLI